MPRMVELFEVEIAHLIFLFDSETHASAFAGLACTGVLSVTACDPLHPQARVELRAIDARMRRVFVASSEKACICAFGKRLTSATPKMLEEIKK